MYNHATQHPPVHKDPVHHYMCDKGRDVVGHDVKTELKGQVTRYVVVCFLPHVVLVYVTCSIAVIGRTHWHARIFMTDIPNYSFDLSIC